MKVHSGVFYCINNPQWKTKCFPKLVYDTKSTDKEGKVCLHRACECGAPFEVIKFILTTYPEAANIQDSQGNTPLRYILQHQKLRRKKTSNTLDLKRMKYVMEVMEELVTVGPSSVLLESQNSKNFFEDFVETFYPPIRELMNSSDITTIESPEKLLNLTIEIEDGTLYKVDFVYKTTLLLLKAAFLSTNDTTKRDILSQQQPFLPLHESLLNKRCPWAFSELIVRIDPAQASLFYTQTNGLPIYCNAKICCSSLDMDYGFDYDLEYKRILLWERFSNPLLCDDEREQVQVLFLIIRENPVFVKNYFCY